MFGIAADTALGVFYSADSRGARLLRCKGLLFMIYRSETAVTDQLAIAYS